MNIGEACFERKGVDLKPFLERQIEGFTELVRASAKAAEMRGLCLDPATVVNLQALGVEPRTAAAAPRLGKAAGGFV